MANILSPIKINNAVDTLHDIRCVNGLIQGLCSRVEKFELTSHEANGLAVIMEWQNERISKVESLIAGDDRP